jgi:Recombination endonuclease VII
MAFVCPSCNMPKGIDRMPKRMRDGRVKSYRCLDCEARAQKGARMHRSDEINRQRRANYPRNAAKQRDTMLRKKYGIDLQEWDSIFRSQGRKCAICFSSKPNGRGWQTDHAHKTGKVRAILCHTCNSLLGHSKESPEILLGAFRYLCIHGGGAENFLMGHFNGQP